ncbi:PASTA domain-containing protein [Actinokineospora sp. NPDC004072]
MRRALAALAALALAGCASTGPPGAPVSVPEVPTLVPPSGSVQALPVPDVVGMEHQAAQDALQAAGFHYLTEEDATGQGRLLVSDRNWVVVAQDPPAGAVVPQSDKILLRSKKKTDP